MTGLDAGSDIGSSIRNPAHFCGLFGHKPSYGVVTPRGHMMPNTLTYADISVVGPLARTAEDLKIALDVMAGPDETDGVGWKLNLPSSTKTRLADFKVAVMLGEPNSAVDREMTDVLQALVDKLAAAGVTVDDAARPDVDFYRAHELYVLLLRAATSARMDQALIASQKAEADALAPGDDSYYARMLRANTMSHPEWLKLNNERAHLRRAWAAFFEEYDLLLCPVAASAAQPHDHEGERWTRTITVNNEQVLTTDQLFWAGISGVVYLPSSVAPAGLTRSNLPVGLQIVGPNFSDHTCIEFARLIEKKFSAASYRRRVMLRFYLARKTPRQPVVPDLIRDPALHLTPKQTGSRLCGAMRLGRDDTKRNYSYAISSAGRCRHRVPCCCSS